MPLKIRVLSDLHVEFGFPYRTHAAGEYRGEQAVVLAGDIAPANLLEPVLEHYSRRFPKVFFVAGNHEYYNLGFEEAEHLITNACLNQGAVWLNPPTTTSVELEDVLFVGGTLWSNFGGPHNNYNSKQFAQARVADFSVIQNFNTDKCERLHYSHWEAIKYHLGRRKPAQKCVVVTHFLPARECIHPRYLNIGGTGELLNRYFSNDYGHWIGDLDVGTTWIYGHSHEVQDFYLGNTRLLSNPAGYWNSLEGHQFDPHKTIVI